LTLGAAEAATEQVAENILDVETAGESTRAAWPARKRTPPWPCFWPATTATFSSARLFPSPAAGLADANALTAILHPHFQFLVHFLKAVASLPQMAGGERTDKQPFEFLAMAQNGLIFIYGVDDYFVLPIE